MRRFLAFLALVSVLVPGTAHGQATVLTIGTTNSPPLSMPDQSGMLDRMLREAFRRIGVQVEFVTLPSERSLTDADHGRIDGDNNRVAGLQAKYPHLIQVPESNMNYDFMAFTTEPSLKLAHWDDLYPLEVAYIIGWKILEDNVKAPKVTKLATPAQLFSFLKAGRADVVLYDRYGGQHWLRELGVSQGYAVEPPLARREMFLYLNERHASLVPALAKAIKDMKADGSWERFLSF